MAERLIVIALYPGVTHLDFTGPHQVLSRTPNAEVIVASPAFAPQVAKILAPVGMLTVDEVAEALRAAG